MSIDTIIIGGGIAGLYYAYNMVVDKNSTVAGNKNSAATNFLILEKNDYIGGRLKTSSFNGHTIVCGAGVGRWHKDKLLKRLLKNLNIPIHKLESKKYYLLNGEIDDYKKNVKDVMAAICAYNKTHPKYRGTFKDIVIKLFDKTTFTNFVKYNGYGDFVNEDFRETIYHYGLEDNYGRMYIFSVPWSLLVNKLVEAIGGNKNIRVNCTVKKIIEQSNGLYTLYTTNDGIYKNIKKIIIATDIPFIKKIFSKNKIYNFVSGQSFSRIYAKVDASHIQIMKDKIKGYTIIESPLQKIIPIDAAAGIYMIGYNDNTNADITKNITKDKLMKMIKDAIGCPIKIINYKIFYWKVGTHFYKPYMWEKKEWPRQLYKMQNPAKRIVVVGEAFSFNQGWVEGALESVAAAFKFD